jgi:hypothetical protein
LEVGSPIASSAVTVDPGRVIARPSKRHLQTMA